ncbi:DEKNAAC100129 [Brettanomyces naardenensis]|uniref:DEKNAAC100129 n=1 Tax=Brettanomyces naardenensis TaxID=13370 RepID=A0A448YEU9_BRENA|nr:DEKNAAC100129 [Brettanomyces naardenensis]
MNPDKCGFYSEADTVSFVNRPFPLEDAYEHLSRIKLCGYNTVRFIVTWEAIEHEGPGIYDIDYVQYVIRLLKIIDEVGGIYVFLDPHQDVWSKFCGGSGAPIWTLYAAGLEPRNFEVTGACKLHNLSPHPPKFTKMVWSTNYRRLASEVMFTMFFSGRMFTPKAIIDGENIQDYFQDHFVEAIAFLVNSIKEQAPELFNSSFMGVESMNEPDCGYYGFENLAEYPENQTLRLDETPKAIQSMRMGMGYREELDLYTLTVFGPKKTGTKVVDPQGVKAWISDDTMDRHYGFTRGEDWELGECIFAQHGVWDSQTGELKRPDYFHTDPITGRKLNEGTFINSEFLSFWKRFRTRLRKVDEEIFLIVQPPVLQIPPLIKGTDLVDRRTGIAIHYYDGMSLIFKSWNRSMNVDTLGIMRGRYINPIFGIVFGERNIRNSFKKQLKSMKEECAENAGKSVPVIMTETGMPFDMDDKKAYNDGNYSSQEGANDALGFALEGSFMNFTYWCYNPENNHKWGDNWNLEDFSVFSRDDAPDNFVDYSSRGSASSSDTKNSKYSEWITSQGTLTSTARSASSLKPARTLKEDGAVELEISMDSPVSSKLTSLIDGVRVPRALVRPYPVLINGVVVDASMNLSTGEYILQIDTSKSTSIPGTPTVIFIPEIHFQEDNFEVSVTSGSTVFKYNSFTQVLEWYHDTSIGVIELKLNSISSPEREASTTQKLIKLLTCGLFC